MLARQWIVIGERADGLRFGGVFSSHRRAARASSKLLDQGIQPDVYQLPRADRFALFAQNSHENAAHWLRILNSELN